MIVMLVMVIVGMEGGDDSCGRSDGGSIGNSECFWNKVVSEAHSGFFTCCSACQLEFMFLSSWTDDHTALWVFFFFFFGPLSICFILNSVP